MPRYRYTATNAAGRTVRGTAEAPTMEALYIQLRDTKDEYMTAAKEDTDGAVAFRVMKTARLADFCVITEDNSRSEPVEHILADIRAGLKLGNPATPFAEIPDRRQAIYYALAHAQPGDIVAILGKGHETTIERNGVKEPFVEREVVEEYWDSKRAVLR